MDPRIKRFVADVAERITENISEISGHNDEKTPVELQRGYRDDLLKILKNSKVLEKYTLLTLHHGDYFGDGGNREALLDGLDLNALDWFGSMFFEDFLFEFVRELIKEIARKYPVDKKGVIHFLTISYNDEIRNQLMYEYQKELRESQKAHGKGSKMTLILRK